MLDDDLALVAGAATLVFGSAPEQQVAPGDNELFFLVFRATADSFDHSPTEVQASFVDDELVARDLNHGLQLVATPGSVSYTGIFSFDMTIFSDGFETGDFSGGWSETAGIRELSPTR